MKYVVLIPIFKETIEANMKTVHFLDVIMNKKKDHVT